MSTESTFGQQVKTRRRELGLTQDELARRVGCAPVTLRKIEYDDLRPSVQIAERLAMALNLPLEERAAFVRLAREERPQFVEPPATPAPALAEIGGEDLTGRAIRGYALGERIGAGGMGAVYRATQPTVEREVAVKIILPQYANQPDFIRRFEAEAQLVARLEHPHIVPLYDYWREPSVAYLVMRLLRGGSVQSLLQGGPVPLDMAVRLLEQIAAALGAAHRVGVVHRDLKPANVLLDEDQNAYLADFGIAKNWSNPAAALTRTDAIVGSPAYISPEQIRSEFVRPQTDIYCLGVMMYELFTGVVPFTGPTPIEVMHQHLNTPLPPLVARRAGLPRALDVVIERATAKDPNQRYENVEELLKDLHRAIPGGQEAEVKTEVLPAPARVFMAADNPYKGLRAFGEGDALDFFGREALTQQLLVRLGEGGDLARFLAVVGPSGSGKSSVVKAGLIPALRRGALPGSEHWFIVELMPGPRPLEELEAALLRVAVNPPASLLDQLKSDKRGLLRAVRRCLPDDASVKLVLVIDQFEEVFTLCEDDAMRAHFLDSLVTAVLDERSRVRVILTLRADFTDRPLAYVDFGELMRHRMEIALPLTPDELEQAIVGPAQRLGLDLEPGLMAAITRDVGDQPGALPLLQYALTNLFERCVGVETRLGAPLLTKQAYAEIGGVLGALGCRAEEVYAALKPDEQHAARQLFLRLVTLGEGVEDTRRRVLRSELESLGAKSQSFDFAQDRLPNSKPQISNQPSTINNVIEAFGRSRLLSFDRDLATRGPTVEVAHEALLREWPRLREWLSDSRADVRLQRQLMQAAQEWEGAKRDASFLLAGTRLAQFEGWMTNTTLALTPEERVFYKASLAERERREQAEAERHRRELETERANAARLRARNRLIAIAGGVALVLAVVAGLFGIESNQNATLAQSNAATAVNAQGVAEQAAKNSFSRELAGYAVNNLSTDPERSVLLALQGVSVADTVEAENALHQAVQASRVRLTINVFNGYVIRGSYSRDGKRFATANWDDGTINIWDTTTGQNLLVITNSIFPVSINFSPDGKHLAVGTQGWGSAGEYGVKVWDTDSGRQFLAIPGCGVSDYSPDGQDIATACWDETRQEGELQVWDAHTGQKLKTLTRLTDLAIKLFYSRDGTRLAVSHGNTATIWDADTGQELLTLPEHTTAVWGIAFSPDGTRLATVGPNSPVNVWNITSQVAPGTNRLLASLPGPLISDGGPTLAFSPDGTKLAAATGPYGIATVWDANSYAKLMTLPVHRGVVVDVGFSPGNTRLATVSSDGKVKFLDLSASHELLTLSGPTGSAIRKVAFSPDGTRIVADTDPAATVWDAATGRELFKLIDTEVLTTSVYEGTVRYGPVTSVAYSPDGTRIATANMGATLTQNQDGSSSDIWNQTATAALWNAATGEKLLTLRGHIGGIVDVAFSSDNKRLVTAGRDGTAIIWDAMTGQRLGTIPVGGDTHALRTIVFNPGGTQLGVSIIDRGITTFGPAQIWRIDPDSQPLDRSAYFSSTTTNTEAVAFSPDGSQFAFGVEANRVIEVWDISAGFRHLLDLFGHSENVGGIAFSPDGTHLASASVDGTTRLWDISTAALTKRDILTLTGHEGIVNNVAFSPDGTRLATAGADGTVRVYALRLEDLIALAKTRVTRTLTEAECVTYLHVAACPKEP